MNDHVQHRRATFHRDQLQSGFVGETCSFEHRPLHERSEGDRRRYEKLRRHLAEHGMLNPLITYKGHVLIGMRRFEILKDSQEYFECVEITENVETWKSQDVTRLQNFKTKLNGHVDPC